MPQKSSALYILGRPLSPLYGFIMKIRESFYQRGLTRRYKLEVPVISVGNLTMGGTGKTPVVGFLARMLQEKGMKPGIISRGYGGAAGNKVNIVSDGQKIFLDAATAGDEPHLLASNLPGIPVLTGIVRVLPCRRAIEEFGCNILLLDDAFQHLSVLRDLDLVLFSGSELAGNSRVFPGGDLREPVSALKRADAFVLTGITEELLPRCNRFKELLIQRFPEKPVFFTKYLVDGVVNPETGCTDDISTLPDSLFAFCGIGHPDLFKKTLLANDISFSEFMPFKDHQKYTSLVQKKILKKALQHNSKAFITTEKDLTKLSENRFTLPCFALKMKVFVDDDFTRFVNNALSTFSPEE